MCLKKVLLKSYLTYIELQTLLSEISHVLNSRPLTHVNDEMLDVITPNKLIFGRDLSNHCNNELMDENDTEKLNENFKKT